MSEECQEGQCHCRAAGERGRGVDSVGELVARGHIRQCLSDHAEDCRFNSKCDGKTAED